MTRRLKKFSEGGDARYDRRLKDIESDYAKAMARKTGRAAEVAKAKRDQRLADAKDDLAKRTGADRTETRAAEKSAERNLTMTRRYGAPSAVKSIESEGPITSTVSTADIAKKTAPAAARGNQAITDSRSFSDAFREARKAGNQPFTWRGKKYSTAMAGKPASSSSPRPATTPRASTPAPKTEPKNNTKADAGAKLDNKPPSFTQGTGASLLRTTGRSSQGVPSRASVDIGRIGRALGEDVAKTRAETAKRIAQQKKAAAERNKPIPQGTPPKITDADWKEALSRGKPSLMSSAKGGKVRGYAKGGKIDGCAVRGKTRAKRIK